MPALGARRVAAAAIMLAAVAGACDAEVAPSEAPAGARAEGNGFVLEASLPKQLWSVGEPIDVQTRLTYVGAEATGKLWGSGSGVVTFSLEEVGGRRVMGGAMTLDCRPYTYPRGVTPVPYRKSGGWSADDPDAAFYQQFFQDPMLRLPAGRWRLTVSTNAYLAPCQFDAPSLNLKLAPIEFEVH